MHLPRLTGAESTHALYDMTGKQICSGYTNGTTTVDTRSLPDGNYILHISNSSLNKRRLLVKQSR
ncbi:MAG: T9SS type A sorting domain-containing protein [Flavipsychrobacter sp.]|nr:T9SS type A sorting domain-containing protein [Flavipsychrobacter sp.]